MKTQNWLLKQAQTNPNHLAIDDGRDRLTFLQVQEKVTILAGKLAQTDAGDKVGLLALNSLDTYLLSLAIICSGKTIVWLNWRLASEELFRQIDDSELKVCLVEDNLLRPEMDDRFIAFSDFQKIAGKDVELVQEFDYDHVASIMYTSGTTGLPKGVLQTFGNHFYSAVSSALNLGLNENDEWLCVAPIFHISGFSIIMRSLIYSMTVRLVAKFDAKKISQILSEEPVSIMSVVPFMLKKLLKIKQEMKTSYNSNFRFMLLGGGTTDKPTLKECNNFSIPVVQCYGMTETCSQIIALKASDALKKIGSVGQPLFTTQLRLLDNGEILLKSPALSPGYLNLPEKMAKKKLDGWYRTGDVGHLDKDGYLYIDGRIDEMMISGGENIFPQEVEQVYLQHPGIDEIAVVGKKNLEWGEVPIAFVVGDQSLKTEDLIHFGFEHLAHYKVPKEYIFVSELPTNASGKIKRYLLREKIN